MKNILKLFSIFLVFSFLSCDSKLELTPEDQSTLSITFSNARTTEGALNGIYDLLQGYNVLNGGLQMMGEWQADNNDFVGTFVGFTQVYNYSIPTNHDETLGVWQSHYAAIGAANLVIKFTPLVNDVNFSDTAKDNFVAQAKFLRALMYFNLANWYSQPLQMPGRSTGAVPLVLEPFEGEVNFPSRNTLNEVYTQIETDLLEALPDLNNFDNSRATRGACLAFLARLYLYQDRNAEAADFANQAINDIDFALAPNYDFYNTTSPEHFFTLVNTTSDGSNIQASYEDLNTPINPDPNGIRGIGRGDTPISQNLIDAYNQEPDDLRFSSLTQQGATFGGIFRTFTNKFSRTTTQSDNAPVFRVTEMYLTRAEANFKEGISIGANPVDDINTLRNRAGLVSLPVITLDVILNERRKELAFEGHRRMDLLRNNMALRRPGMPNETESQPTSTNKVIFPIPEREIELNTNLAPNNPPYL
ncbi:RagB/SusD family nutrient uptake outer membrane protein [uncultured Tenacibaculum sp.]|uniref:RagB/SusD family nutrient uptake outer membrane protein n=1 Tax=uncultured Tenacibaculum sp. TaxID=174713 RepID=UPI0026202535|nr:RagB/SusD family nutrient uptake outer membrane protein [uncultured Tenacibaculum sp.]